MSWEGQVAIVTGGSRGIGRAIVRRLGAAGAAVGVNYATQAEEAEASAGDVREAGGRAVAVQADVGDAGEVERLVSQVEAELGPVTILVNNAGLSLQAKLEDYDPEAMARMRRTNVDGVIHTTRAVAPGMRARGYGRIVNVTSIAAHGTRLPGNAFYGASKAEVDLLTRRFAMELGPSGITVNAIAPGFIATEMTRRSRHGTTFEELSARLAEITMMCRVGEPDDIAHAVAFLTAPEAGFITAQTLTVDGGRMDYTGHR
ncbi:MAG: glucose 1-dehydrogenase [Candidatus Dormibacteraeota bacterium]|nr:glucose 1-dehydrogenase [Candidatus Dormibacteraeota bacterium]MBO0761584.1 glucose 1-dehydrogenase [Candidatus Dormibacteraeota bacterium]